MPGAWGRALWRRCRISRYRTCTTCAKPTAIGASAATSRRPAPHPLRSPNGANPTRRGDPDCLRFDTVHQGDLDGIKGVYHINAVDEVTQFQCVFSVEPISERFLIPILKALIETASMPITARSRMAQFLSYSPSESIGWRTSLTRSALLFGVAIAAHFLTCLGPRLGHERIGLWSPLEDSWLNAPGASTHPRRGDEQQKAADTDCIVGATTALLPAEPDLHGMLEAQLTWDLVGKQGGLRHQ